MQEKIKRLAGWFSGNKQLPFSLDISPTDYCNLSCLSCWLRNKKYKNLDSRAYELNDKRLLQLIDEAIELGVKEFEITGGGEPLVRKVTFELMKKIKEHKANGSITTNGTLLTEDTIKELVKIGWDRIIFSIDGASSVVNDFLRGNSFNKIVKNIKIFKRYKEEFGKNKPLFSFNTVVSNKNYNKLKDTVNLAAKLNVASIKFESLTVHSKIGENLRLDKEEIEELQQEIHNIDNISKVLGVKTNILDFDIDLKNPNKMDRLLKKEFSKRRREKDNFLDLVCFEPWYHLIVKTDGAIGPCCLADDKTLNIKDTSLKEVWFSSYFKKLRENILKGKFPKYCSVCNIGQISQNRLMKQELRKYKNARKN